MIKRLFVMMLLACSPVLGQTFDTFVSGKVRMPDGGSPGAISVTLTTLSPNNRTVYRAQAKDDGSFRFENVRPGEYTVFAGAALAQALPEGIEAGQVLVVTPPTGILNNGPGTYYPGTAELSKATAITIAAGATVDNVNFTLVSGSSVWGGPAFRSVPAKIVVEGGGTPTFHSDQFGLLFSDTPANVSTTVAFVDGARKPAKAVIRVERQREPFLASAVIPMPAFPNGEFRLALPEGTIRVSPVAPIRPAADPASHVVAPARSLYYIKSMTFGAVDLMKSLMTLRAPVQDTLVITLARCTETVKDEPLCR